MKHNCWNFMGKDRCMKCYTPKWAVNKIPRHYSIGDVVTINTGAYLNRKVEIDTLFKEEGDYGITILNGAHKGVHVERYSWYDFRESKKDKIRKEGKKV